MKIEKISIDKLKTYDKNVKQHPPEQINNIAISIKEFGFNVPLLIDKNNVLIAGHGRLLAAQILEMKEVPVIRLENLTPEQAQAFRIADNKVTESPFDIEILKYELAELSSKDFDLTTLGFTPIELEALVGAEEIDVNKEWHGMPEYESQELSPYRQITISFKNNEDINAFAKLLDQTITDKTKSLWFPKAEIDKVSDLRY